MLSNDSFATNHHPQHPRQQHQEQQLDTLHSFHHMRERSSSSSKSSKNSSRQYCNPQAAATLEIMKQLQRQMPPLVVERSSSVGSGSCSSSSSSSSSEPLVGSCELLDELHWLCRSSESANQMFHDMVHNSSNNNSNFSSVDAAAAAAAGNNNIIGIGILEPAALQAQQRADHLESSDSILRLTSIGSGVFHSNDALTIDSNYVNNFEDYCANDFPSRSRDDFQSQPYPSCVASSNVPQQHQQQGLLPHNVEPSLQTETDSSQQQQKKRCTPTKGTTKQRCTKRPKEASQEVDDDVLRDYIDGHFTSDDVLMGRGGLANQHPGNQAYLRAKEGLQSRYLAALKHDKTGISQELVDKIHARGGRFLKQDSRRNQWYEVDNATARTKASQTLREINTAENRARKRAKYNHKPQQSESAHSFGV
jgi:hypothetical protein